MPLFQELSTENAKIYLWKYSEGENLDIHQLLEPENLGKIKNYPTKKVLETLMVRKILQEKLPQHKILYQDREPYLFPESFNISISHSFPYAVLAFSKAKIGVDIEPFSEKVVRLKDKFTQKQEQDFIPKNKEMKYLTAIWSIKESLYKLHPSKYWSLKKHYEVYPFTEENFHRIQCRVYDEHFSDAFSARVSFFEDFVLSIVE